MADVNYEALKLENQLCFPLYACAREVVKRYKPFLDDIDLTYTQYVTMMVLWEKPSVTSKEIGERLHLDSGTLTPVIKKLAEKGLVTRARSAEDERNLKTRKVLKAVIAVIAVVCVALLGYIVYGVCQLLI